MSDKRDALLQASSRTAGQAVIYTDTVSESTANGVPLVKMWVPSALAHDFGVILTNLPEILQEHLTITELLPRLLGVCVQQQMEISRLSGDLQALRKAVFVLDAQKTVRDIVHGLVDKGSDVTNYKVRMQIRETSSQETEGNVDKQSVSSRHESGEVNVTGEMQTLIEALAGLKFGYEREASRIAQQFEKLMSQAKESGEKTFEGIFETSVESVTGDPRIKAEAALTEAKAEAVKAGRIPPSHDNL